MFEGTLLSESLRTGAVLDTVALTVRRIARYAVGGATQDQPAIWTAIDFEITDPDAEALASALAGALGDHGWYANFQSDTEAYVVFADKVFHYPRGDAAGRAAAQAYGRQAGVPETQLDWTV
jgi:hypothetical protein